MDDDNPYASPQSTGSAYDRQRFEQQQEEASAAGIDLVQITSFPNISEALLCQSVFRSHGIESYLDNEGGAGAGLHWVNSVRGIKVLVASPDAEAAAGMLADVNEKLQQADNSAPITFSCEECNAEITFPGNRRGHVETCPKCQEYVDVPD